MTSKITRTLGWIAPTAVGVATAVIQAITAAVVGADNHDCRVKKAPFLLNPFAIIALAIPVGAGKLVADGYPIPHAWTMRYVALPFGVALIVAVAVRWIAYPAACAFCDHSDCGACSAGLGVRPHRTYSRLNAALKAAGWYVTDEVDYCPQHADAGWRADKAAAGIEWAEPPVRWGKSISPVLTGAQIPQQRRGD